MERCIDDEIPFEIPDSWVWVRFGGITDYGATRPKINAQYASGDTWCLDLEDIERGGRLLAKIQVKSRSSKGEKTQFQKGDILYSKLRPYLLKMLIAPDDGICTPEIVPFIAYGSILPKFVLFYLGSPYVDYLINSVTYGVKMPRVGTDTIRQLLFPLPPLSEQHRIVEKIEELMPIITEL